MSLLQQPRALPNPAPQPRIATRLLLHHISKLRNYVACKQVAAAFLLDEIVLVGRRKATDDNERLTDMPGAPRIRHFKYFREALLGLQLISPPPVDTLQPTPVREAEPPCDSFTKEHLLVGIEIQDGAVPAQSLAEVIHARFPRCRSVTLLPGNEGSGMLPMERDCCDLFVFVPQHSRVGGSDKEQDCGGAGSLNVASAVTVVVDQLVSRLRGDEPLRYAVPWPLSMETVMPFDEAVEGGRQAHYLIRIATSLGSARLSVVSERRIVAGTRMKKHSMYRGAMSAEAHVAFDSFLTLPQALASARAACSGDESKPREKTIVIGVASAMTALHHPAMDRILATSGPVRVVIVLGVVHEADAAQCDVLMPSVTAESMPLACMLSAVLFRFCVAFGLVSGAAHGHVGIDGKFGVQTKREMQLAARDAIRAIRARARLAPTFDAGRDEIGC